VHESGDRLRELDGLRGLAAFSVFLGHASILGVPAGVWSDGGAAVALFFVLSGFVLARSLLANPQSYGQFVRRRILRLYPGRRPCFAWRCGRRTILPGSNLYRNSRSGPGRSACIRSSSIFS
jgi:peptidoglycan/LPS O-acetylase OafA/YrhL